MATAERQVTIHNQLGLHVRPAAQLAATAMRFRAEVRIVRNNQEVNAKSSLELLTLAASHGATLTLRADGDDAEAAVATIAGLIESRFGEET